MSRSNWFRPLLCVPGIQYLATRFGGPALRALSFDEKFRTGTWDFASQPDSELVKAVERYAERGNILMLGCGTASIAGVLNPECFSSFRGIDLSSEAIARARGHCNHKIHFEVGDMLAFSSEQKFSVILFSESLYYAAAWKRGFLVRKAVGMLAPGGRVIVTVAQPARFAGMIRMLRRNFEITDESTFPGSQRRLIVLCHFDVNAHG